MDKKQISITPEVINEYKRSNPNDTRIQALTRDDVAKNTGDVVVNWHELKYDEEPEPEPASRAGALTPCQLAIGRVVVDTVFWALGVFPLRTRVKAWTIRRVARAVQPMQSKLEAIIVKMAEPGVSKQELVRLSLDILDGVRPALGDIWKAFTSDLTWWERVAYGLVGTATVIGFIATEEVALPVEIAAHAVSLAPLASECVKAAQTCKASRG